jgi:hypothetical protein
MRGFRQRVCPYFCNALVSLVLQEFIPLFETAYYLHNFKGSKGGGLGGGGMHKGQLDNFSRADVPKSHCPAKVAIAAVVSRLRELVECQRQLLGACRGAVPRLPR